MTHVSVMMRSSAMSVFSAKLGGELLKWFTCTGLIHCGGEDAAAGNIPMFGGMFTSLPARGASLNNSKVKIQFHLNIKDGQMMKNKRGVL